jgi:hypothetical protein
MSFVNVVAEELLSAAADTASIGSSLSDARAAALGPTTGITATASDEVSAAITTVFNTFGQEYQALSAQAATFHAEFVSLLTAGSTSEPKRTASTRCSR